MNIRITLLIFLFCQTFVFAQNNNVGIGTTTPDASAVLDINSTSQGMLTPRMSESDRTGISSPAKGLLVYQTDGNEGFYYYDGSEWVYLNAEGFLSKIYENANIPEACGEENWLQKADFGVSTRRNAIAFSLNGKAYVGAGFDGSYRKDFWEYDPNLDAWTQKADFGGTARNHAVAFAINGKAYVGTGFDGSYKKDFWVYDPTTDTWTQIANFGGTARYHAVAFTLDGKGYVGTGFDGSNKKDFWEYDPDLDTWAQKTDFGGSARYSTVAFTLNGKGYVGTGYDGSNKKDCWEYNPIADTWTQKANFGGSGRNSAVAFALNGKGYVGTGSGGNKDFWEYNPVADNWTQKSDFGSSARIEAVAFTLNGKAYVGTGWDGSSKKDIWEYCPGNFGAYNWSEAYGWGNHLDAGYLTQEIDPLGSVAHAWGDHSLAGYLTSATGLEEITENGQTGWRIAGRNPARYGDIGDGAIDLSYSTSASSTRGAAGNRSFVAGIDNTASAPSSYVFGQNSEVSGINSFAAGLGLNVSKSTAFALGKYNVGGSDKLFEIGFGISDANRKNLLTVLDDGNTGIGLDDPLTTLHIKSIAEQSNVNEGAVKIQNANGTQVLQLDGNEIDAKNQLYINYNTASHVNIAQGGGNVEIANGNGNVDIASGSGNVSIANGAGDVTIASGGGDVSIASGIGNVGIGTIAPSSKLHINGTWGRKVTTITTAGLNFYSSGRVYNVTDETNVLILDNQGVNTIPTIWDIVLPDPSNCQQRVITIKNPTFFNLTIRSQNFNGNNAAPLVEGVPKYSVGNFTSITVINDGANWQVLDLYKNGLNDLLHVNQGTIHIGTLPTPSATPDPPRAKLEVNGSENDFMTGFAYLWDPSGSGTSAVTGYWSDPNTGPWPFSIWASDRIAADRFYAFSDQRIKNIQGISNSQKDLHDLMAIEITDYTLKDSIGKGKQTYKKVIAQQVAEVYPLAVETELTDVVPDIYQKAELKGGWVQLDTDLKAGERVKIITKEATQIYDVIEATPTQFKVQGLAPTNQQPTTVFVYGREVDDFHTVDYEAIAMLNVSATQEQQRLIEQLLKENADLKAENETMKADIQDIKEALKWNATAQK